MLFIILVTSLIGSRLLFRAPWAFLESFNPHIPDPKEEFAIATQTYWFLYTWWKAHNFLYYIFIFPFRKPRGSRRCPQVFSIWPCILRGLCGLFHCILYPREIPVFWKCEDHTEAFSPIDCIRALLVVSPHPSQRLCTSSCWCIGRPSNWFWSGLLVLALYERAFTWYWRKAQDIEI